MMALGEDEPTNRSDDVDGASPPCRRRRVWQTRRPPPTVRTSCWLMQRRERARQKTR
nr:unnamed protein product [Digitaria exilis]